MRIAVDGRVLQDRYHGIGRYTFELLRCLVKRDVELCVLRDPGAASRLPLEELKASEHVRLVDFASPVVGLTAQRHWPRVLASLNADALFVPYHLAVPMLPTATPTLAVIHDCIFEREPAVAPGGRGFLLAYRVATRLALARAGAVATISDATRHDVRRYYGVVLPPGNVLPTGVDLRFSAGRPTAPGPALDLPKRFVLHVGVHRPHKNHAVLLAAFARLVPDHPDLFLVLVGQSDERFPRLVDRLVHEHQLQGRVRVLRDVGEERLLELYRGASMFAFPSLYEGFGLPVLEAMAAGVPVVASDAEAVREAAGGAALETPAGDVDLWERNLRRVLGDEGLAGDLRRRGLAVAAQRTWDKTSDRALALLESTASRPQQARPAGTG